MKIGILGGGLAGVSLAYFLEKKGHDVEVLEKEEECGGLCRSFSKDGFSFDLGGHIIFSKDKQMLDLMINMLGSNVKKHYRNNKVWFKGRYVKYPFENGLSALDKEDIFECLNYFINNDYPKPKNLKEWCYYTFGKGIAEKYLVPYNTKIWNIDPARISLEWVDRIPKPPVEDVIKSAIGIETEGYTHQLYFYYPIRGGIQALVKAFEDKLKKVTKKYAVKEIEKLKNGWRVSNGAEDRYYDRVISCIPIFDLAAALKGVPKKISDIIRKKLKYNSLSTVMLGIDKDKLSDKFAVYVPQKDLLFHRICFHSYMGPWYTPKGTSSVVAEITTNQGDVVHEMTDKQLIDHVRKGLDKEGLVDSKLVCASDIKRMKYAYVLYDLNYRTNMKIINEYFRSLRLPLNGRFAQFEYLNMDAVVRNSFDLAGKVKP